MRLEVSEGLLYTNVQNADVSVETSDYFFRLRYLEDLAKIIDVNKTDNVCVT